MVQLTNEQLIELKSTFGDLESKANENYALRKSRPIVGDDSVLMRTLGDDFKGPLSYKGTYFDEVRKKDVLTEFREFIDELLNYDASPSAVKKMDLYMEAGDILFQKAVLDLKHRENSFYPEVSGKFAVAISYVEEELSRRGLSIDSARRAAVIKYGVRYWLDTHGLKGKDEELEKMLCLEELENA